MHKTVLLATFHIFIMIEITYSFQSTSDWIDE